MRRVIRPLPRKGIVRPPQGAWLVDDALDYLDDGSTPDPADAIYVAEDKNGTVVERVNKFPPGKTHRHDRDGWPMPKKGKGK